ncbi:unnamed protein product, partial [Heterotrigona itama]
YKRLLAPAPSSEFHLAFNLAIKSQIIGNYQIKDH